LQDQTVYLKAKMMLESKLKELNKAEVVSQRSDISIVVAALKRLMDAALTAGLSRSSPAYETAAVVAETASFEKKEVGSTQVLDDLRWIEEIVEGYDHVGTGSGKGAKEAYRKTTGAWARLRALITGAAQVDPQATRIADAMEACDWSGCPIGNKEILKAAVRHLRANPFPSRVEDEAKFDVDELAQEIRRVDGSHSMGAGALAEALIPFIERAAKRQMATALN
jgi:hypothetical protein